MLSSFPSLVCWYVLHLSIKKKVTLLPHFKTTCASFVPAMAAGAEHDIGMGWWVGLCPGTRWWTAEVLPDKALQEPWWCAGWLAWTFTVMSPFFHDIPSAVLTMLRFEELSPLFCSCTDKHCTWYMLYLISRRICLTERKKCGLALLLFWFAEFERDDYNACNVSYTCTT